MLYELGEKRVILPGSSYVAPGAVVIGDVVFGDACSVWFNAVIRGDNDEIRVGAGSNIQECSVLHVDEGFPIAIGENVTIGHKVMLHGCSIGDGSLIGMNAVVLNGARVGKNCLVGANALVTEGKQIPDGSLVLGSPAKVVRQLSEKHLSGLQSAARHYQQKITLYKTQLKEMGST